MLRALGRDARQFEFHDRSCVWRSMNAEAPALSAGYFGGAGSGRRDAFTAGWVMRTFSDLQELRAAVGTQLGVSDWVEVSQEKIEQFARATGDDQLDSRRCRACSSGTAGQDHDRTRPADTLTRAGVHPSCRPCRRLTRTLNYGSDRVRYLSAVPAGSRLRGRVFVAAADEVPPDGLRVTYGITVEIENRDRPACVAEMIALHYC